jgi:rRNA maturation endonuclease Nob1/ketosteroid isomerase-like protein
MFLLPNQHRCDHSKGPFEEAQMLYCLSCNIEYKDDKKYCNFCGSPLVPKEDLPTSPKDKPTEERARPICPNCKISYEFGSSCIQCGATLISQFPTQGKEEPKIVSAPVVEEKPSQEQVSHEQLIKASPNDLICPTCKAIYEHGNFCIKCGAALVPQISTPSKEDHEVIPETQMEEASLQGQANQKPFIEISRKNLICPDCKILYERGQTCIRCGSALVKQIPPPEEETNLSETPEVNPSTSQPESGGLPLTQDFDVSLSQSTQAEGLGVESEESFFPYLKEQETSATKQVKHEDLGDGHTLAEVKEKPGQTQTPDQPLTKKSTEDSERKFSIPKWLKRDYRRLFLEVGSISIMVLAGGYFLWSIYANVIKKRPEPEVTVSKEVVRQIPSNSSASNTPQPSVREQKELINSKVDENSSISKEETSVTPIPSSLPDASETPPIEMQEIKNIKNLLENIRQANIQKDIDLFISCYASDFKDREGKKKTTLVHWKNFDYIDLSYDLKNSSISGDMAKAKVEWLITIFPRTGGHRQESRTILDVTLKKEEDGWKIKEVKPIG